MSEDYWFLCKRGHIFPKGKEEGGDLYANSPEQIRLPPEVRCNCGEAVQAISVRRLSDSGVGFRFMIDEEVANKQSNGRLSMIDRGTVKEGYFPESAPGGKWYDVRRSNGKIFQAKEGQIDKVARRK